MKVILNADVENLGEEGTVVEIADGYARNYLFPKKLCLPLTAQNKSVIHSRRRAIEERRRQKELAALSIKERLNALELYIRVPVGETGRLFGSVNNATIADALAAEGFNVSRRQIELSQRHIKIIGRYTAQIKLYGQEVAELSFVIISDKEEELQTKSHADKQSGSDTVVSNAHSPEEGVSTAEESAATEPSLEAEGHSIENSETVE